MKRFPTSMLDEEVENVKEQMKVRSWDEPEEEEGVKPEEAGEGSG